MMSGTLSYTRRKVSGSWPLAALGCGLAAVIYLEPRFERPGLSLFSVNRRAPNRGQPPALVKWSWRPFWGCRRCDKSRPVACLWGVGALG
jgi:hypothetical protein